MINLYEWNLQLNGCQEVAQRSRLFIFYSLLTTYGATRVDLPDATRGVLLDQKFIAGSLGLRVYLLFFAIEDT